MDFGSPLFVTGSLGIVAALAPRTIVFGLSSLGLPTADFVAIESSLACQLAFAVLATTAGATTFALALRQHRDRPTLISIVCAAGTFASFAWFHAATTFDAASAVAAVISSCLTAWGIAASGGLPKAGKQPPRYASPLYIGGLILLSLGTALYVAPSICSSLLGRVLPPLTGLAELATLPPFWRLALPALAAAFGAQLQHLAASGSEREHSRFCRALAAGCIAAGITVLSSSVEGHTARLGGASACVLAAVLVLASARAGKRSARGE